MLKPFTIIVPMSIIQCLLVNTKVIELKSCSVVGSFYKTTKISDFGLNNENNMIKKSQCPRTDLNKKS